MPIRERTLLSLTAVLLTSVCAHADGSLPSHGNFLTSWGSTDLAFFTDGTSNTIAFTETTRLTFCVDNVGIQGAPLINPIHDGSSNTILFGEAAGFAVKVGLIAPPHPISEIVDGTSNTILFGEIPVDGFCLGNVTPINTGIVDGASNTIVFGEDSHFDVCADNVRIGRIVDGTSNTIAFGEVVPRSCLDNVRVSGPSDAAVPEPGSLVLFGLTASWFVFRRRKAT